MTKRCEVCGGMHSRGTCPEVRSMMKADSYKRIGGAVRQVGWADRSSEDGRAINRPVFENSAAFAERVAADVRGRIDPALRRPENVQAWHDELVFLRQDVEAQLAERKAEMEAYRLEAREKGSPSDDEEFARKCLDYERWRARTIRFMSHVNRRITEAKRIIEEVSGSLWAENERLRKENERLREQLARIGG